MALELKPEVIAAEWDKDCAIDELDLIGSIRAVPLLHSKYINLLSQAKLRHRAVTSKYNSLRQRKFKYYRGEMTKEELTELGWTQWQGLKPLRSEMNEFLQGDTDLTTLEDRLGYLDVIVSMLEAIVRSINSRGYDLKTMLEAKKFYQGMN